MSPADHPGQEPQSAGAVLMVRPARFGCNPQTAESNAFQAKPELLAGQDLQGVALREFHGLAEALDRAGVEVLIAPDSEQPAKPDAIFPNNWVSFHHDGTVALYPMLAPNRRWERRDEILQQVVRDGGFRVSRTVDLTHRESEDKYLEGTGSVVLDRVHRVAYACSSPRTDLDVLGEFAQQLDYELMTFDAVDAGGAAIYHTNVLMAIGTGFAVVCSESIVNDAHRAAVLSKLGTTGHAIVEITAAQMAQFAGNILELAAPKGRIIALSTTALGCLGAAQRRALESRATLIPAQIPTIERIGGGGVRCMLAEIHLPKRDRARA
ncbi:MAG TPA: arginine deiminase-related protein [Steroidobacteraceae bacterium]|jgi:hypothetical protein|nr:arginine deiminase-related protein [Steroidobacteraceae bacterium]